jgi:UDP-glucose 4-epimerase
MKVLITGVNSFIGRVITEKLINIGSEIIGLYNTESKFINNLKSSCPCIRLFNINIKNFNEFAKINCSPDYVIHAASISNGLGVTEKEMAFCNVNGSQNIAKYAFDQNVKKIIYLSSVSVYGNVTDSLISEKTIINNPDHYGKTKYEAENIFKKLDIPTIAIRLPGVLGYGATRAWIPTLCERLLNNEDIHIYNPESIFNNLVAVDEVSLFITSILNNCSSIGFHAFPIGAKNGIVIHEIVRLAKSILDSKSDIKIGSKKSEIFNIDSSYAEKNFLYSPSDTLEILIKYLYELKNAKNKR